MLEKLLKQNEIEIRICDNLIDQIEFITWVDDATEEEIQEYWDSQEVW